MSKEIRSFTTGSNLEVRAANGKNKISGYAVRFNQPSQNLGGFLEYCDSKMFDRTLRENPDVLLLRDHHSELLLGRSGVNLKLTTDSQGLRFDCDLLDNATANTAYSDIDAGLLSGCSFGFFVVSDKWSQGSDGLMRRDLLDVDLFECSVTSFPAYTQTNVDARALSEIRSKLSKRGSDADDANDICTVDGCECACHQDDTDSRNLLVSLLRRRMIS